MAFRRILCPIDFSTGSDHAVTVALSLSDADTELVLCHAGDHATPENARRLDEAVARAKAAGARRVSAKIVRGRAVEVITDTLVDPSFDLCVIGTHNRTGIEYTLLGSVAEKVVPLAPCPTLVVRLAREPRPFRHALCPVDFSIGSAQALELADTIVPAGGRVTLLAVEETPDPHIEARLQDWAGSIGRPGREVRAIIRSGLPGAQIVAEVEDDPTIDLVTIGSHGRKALERVVLGSVADKVAHSASCAVLVAHHRGLGYAVT